MWVMYPELLNVKRRLLTGSFSALTAVCDKSAALTQRGFEAYTPTTWILIMPPNYMPLTGGRSRRLVISFIIEPLGRSRISIWERSKGNVWKLIYTYRNKLPCRRNVMILFIHAQVRLHMPINTQFTHWIISSWLRSASTAVTDPNYYFFSMSPLTDISIHAGWASIARTTSHIYL